MSTTIDELFTLAIAAERAAESLYVGLEEKFAHHPEVVKFWKKYAAEEDGHARWLIGTQARLTDEQRTAEADPLIVERVRNVLNYSIEDALASIEDLEDAFQLVNEIENSETNAVFEFLIENFADDPATMTFLRGQLRSHISNLMIDFPVKFRSAVLRRGIKAL